MPGARSFIACVLETFYIILIICRHIIIQAAAAITETLFCIYHWLHCDVVSTHTRFVSAIHDPFVHLTILIYWLHLRGWRMVCVPYDMCYDCEYKVTLLFPPSVWCTSRNDAPPLFDNRDVHGFYKRAHFLILFPRSNWEVERYCQQFEEVRYSWLHVVGVGVGLTRWWWFGVCEFHAKLLM